MTCNEIGVLLHYEVVVTGRLTSHESKLSNKVKGKSLRTCSSCSKSILGKTKVAGVAFQKTGYGWY